ncbi:MAG: FecR domain-containing protein [Gemmatimonadaceae bacterium]|nr:FecR domain-containing protein [Gemmatimonadaceae bacterium]
MSDPVDDLLLDRYAAGECDSAERAYVDRMLATDAAWARRMEQLRTLRRMTQRLPQPWDVDRMWDELRERRAASARVVRALPRTRRGAWGRIARLAAAVVLALGSGALWYAAHGGRFARVPHDRIEAPNGRITSIRLADGSRVTLAAGSVLDAPRTFDGRGRDVTLTGQAYFEIAHDSTRPFRVHTRGALTRVLGTKFGVRAYPEDSDVTVVVTEGHVMFGAAPGATSRGTPAGVTLAAGDRAQLVPDGSVRVEHGVAMDRDLAWMQGRLVFVDTPLSTVVREVERWYDVHIVLADTSLASAPVTASFGNEPVDRVLRTLAVSLDVPFTRHGDTVSFGTPR